MSSAPTPWESDRRARLLAAGAARADQLRAMLDRGESCQSGPMSPGMGSLFGRLTMDDLLLIFSGAAVSSDFPPDTRHLIAEYYAAWMEGGNYPLAHLPPP
jgi:hypothetical protein